MHSSHHELQWKTHGHIAEFFNNDFYSYCCPQQLEIDV